MSGQSRSSRRGVGSGRRTFVVRALSPQSSRGVLEWGSQRAPCALGRSGVRVEKREGDGATPRGIWIVREAFYNADRMRRPSTHVPLRRLRLDDGWCDARMDRNYNRAVRHPYPASAERLFRADGLYDIVIVLGYNDRPRVQGRGSAIFLHVARPGYLPTEGCVALRRDHALRLIANLRRGDVVQILL